MPLRTWLEQGFLKTHKTTRSEIRELLRVVDRDLRDATVNAISIDLRFHAAYQAAFRLATLVLFASGYRTAGSKHHLTRFRVLPDLLGSQYRDVAEYFDQSRSKRNVADYDRAGEIAEAEADELLEEARKFRESVLSWLKKHHPSLVP